MDVLVLQPNHGTSGVKVSAAVDDRAPEHAWHQGAAAVLERRSRSRVLGVQQPPWGRARQTPEEKAEQMVVSDLLNDARGG